MGAPGSRFPTFSRLLSVYEAEIKTTGGFLFTSSSYSRSAGIGQACKVHKRVALFTLYAIFTLLHTEFPRKPTGVLKGHLTTEADNRLGCYLPIPEPEKPPDPTPPAPAERPKLPEDVVDAPLVRIYNFLRKCCPLIVCETEIGRRNDVNVVPVGDTLVSGMFFYPHNGCTTSTIPRDPGRTSAFTWLGRIFES